MADDERLDRRVTTRARLGHGDLVKEELELGDEQRDVLAAKDLGNEAASGARLEHMGGDVESGEDELSLHELVDVVQTRHVRRAVAHDQIGLLAFEMPDYLIGRFFFRYVTWLTSTNNKTPIYY